MRNAVLAALLTGMLASTAHAEQAPTDKTAAAASAPLAVGEVKKVDAAAGKLTIQHGPLANLNMPGMTMSFKVKDAAMLGQVKTGDKIQFLAERINGAFVVTRLEAAN